MKYFLFFAFLPAFLLGSSCFFIEPKASYVKMDIEQEPNVVFMQADQGISLEGYLAGLKVGYSYQKKGGIYALLSGEYLWGDLSDSIFPGRDLKRTQAETRIGYSYPAMQGKKLLATPYLGLGFCYESQDREPYVGELSSTLFEYFTIYLPIGFLLDYAIYPFFHMGFHFQWRPDLDPTLKLETLPYQREKLQRKNSQFLVELPFDFWFGCRCSRVKLSMAPFWQERKEGATLDKQTLAIPQNNFTEWGGKALLSIYF